ncbi:septal ring lytic transglycosylase RlpA family protein [Nonomuraea sp. NPDC005501]|uniref:septal ring lytic transglycosylase RlpA family protein n=1 Tax=Nonomuraea sp. NPDC005501 TaxID=3156884 RepID=UPI0033B5C562
MGQHSQKPFHDRPLSRLTAPGKRRWTTVAAGAALLAAASTTAWAGVSDDEPPTAAALASNPSPASAAATTAAPSPPAPSPAATAPSVPASSPTAAAKPPAPAKPKPAAAPVAAAKVKTVRTKTVRAKSTKSKTKSKVLSRGTCGASYYDEGQMTASGERFNPSAMTAAHKTLPLGSRVRVINPRNGDSVTVRINDRGPYVGGRCLDLSRAAFAAIGSTGAGVMRVTYEVLAR